MIQLPSCARVVPFSLPLGLEPLASFACATLKEAVWSRCCMTSQCEDDRPGERVSTAFPSSSAPFSFSFLLSLFSLSLSLPPSRFRLLLIALSSITQSQTWQRRLPRTLAPPLVSSLPLLSLSFLSLGRLSPTASIKSSVSPPWDAIARAAKQICQREGDGETATRRGQLPQRSLGTTTVVYSCPFDTNSRHLYPRSPRCLRL